MGTYSLIAILAVFLIKYPETLWNYFGRLLLNLLQYMQQTFVLPVTAETTIESQILS